MLSVAKRNTRLGLLAAAIAILALLFASCTGDDDNGTALGGLTPSQLQSLATSGGGFSIGSSGIGIHATGVGVVEAAPDIAILSMGVDSFASTVAEANATAATAMDAMLTALRNMGVSNDDMETRFFNIQPEYTYDQVFVTSEDGERFQRSERRLTGYRVTNTLSVTLRNLDSVGTTVDAVVAAGGDAARINNIAFSIEEGSALEVEARTLALQDAVAKADLYASEAGASRGKLVFVSESSFPQFPRAIRLESASSDQAASAPSTAILAGDLTIRVTVNTVFEID
jgi:uncharacterized protein YggE